MSHPIFERWVPQHPDRIQLYSLNTPNGIKVGVILEELELPYEPHTINIMEDDQFDPAYKTLSPNSKIPAIVDPNGPDGKPLGIMESGAILIYLADKAGRLIPQAPAQRSECLQWVFFQVGHVGPMFGQFGHFHKFAGDKCDHPYPLERYKTESKRLLGVLEDRLAGREYILDSGYSIADIAIFPWVNTMKGFYQAEVPLEISRFENVNRWLARCLERPAVQRGLVVCALS
ncbi:Glutathione S-transferase N-terminal domain-containing protein [Sulfidibacter corallicola]|uniref:Glutathione S-transferase N-terminal domain-containing protein n=1 Tax=Sulfidibacter corallicola TaxID=2818388 RepID=A0A8A4TRC9_SULCO|nr:glutathione S-transferase C-terminal domain-containing protein [Sulfidibacter corallicola]QTD51568.1 glutathione S-transferase N-terminal domain-containing protein [Sulfidibacter corallicola]